MWSQPPLPEKMNPASPTGEGEPPMRKRLALSALSVVIATIAVVVGNATAASASAKAQDEVVVQYGVPLCC
ncbi:hypothetical protein GCM10009560_61320 [Nonomuraea longicatena]|uniref:Uncharacterized protein n=1 Tax=Nonomuraea longicatena TaxID=83682 RepID=A0ABN1QRR5_9ACTN